MSRRGFIAGIMITVASCGLAVYAQPPGFDLLADQDRKTFEKRFEKEIWPLMQRNGAAGCVGCHSGKQVTALKLTGVVAKDFPMLVREGFFLPDDAGSLLSRIEDKDPQRRMPRGKAKPWTPDEIKVLRDFVVELDKKQKK